MSAYIELKDICFGYKKTGFSIEGASLALHSGRATALMGGTGSGKTTLSKLMMGILKPDSGSVAVDGQNIETMGLAQVAKKVGYLFQNPERQLFCETALEEIKFSLRYQGVAEAEADARARDLLSRFSMLERAGDFPLKLSRGEKQRLALLAVLATEPPYYILDEPSSGIDGENKEKLIAMLEALKRGGAGLLFITHDRSLADRLADDVVTMAGGRIEHARA